MVLRVQDDGWSYQGRIDMRPPIPRRLERLLNALAAQVGTLPTVTETEARNILGLPFVQSRTKPGKTNSHKRESSRLHCRF